MQLPADDCSHGVPFMATEARAETGNGVTDVDVDVDVDVDMSRRDKMSSMAMQRRSNKQSDDCAQASSVS